MFETLGGHPAPIRPRAGSAAAGRTGSRRAADGRGTVTSTSPFRPSQIRRDTSVLFLQPWCHPPATHVPPSTGKVAQRRASQPLIQAVVSAYPKV